MKNLTEEKITEILEKEPHLLINLLEDEIESIGGLDKKVNELNNLFSTINLEKTTINIDFIKCNLKDLDLDKYDVFQKENIELLKENLEKYEEAYQVLLKDIEIFKKNDSFRKYWF